MDFGVGVVGKRCEAVENLGEVFGVGDFFGGGLEDEEELGDCCYARLPIFGLVEEDEDWLEGFQLWVIFGHRGFSGC